MRIALSLAQQDRLLAWAAECGANDVEAVCEPCGYVLEISIGIVATATARWGPLELDLGDVAVQLTPA